jgi:hypothetical protein
LPNKLPVKGPGNRAVRVASPALIQRSIAGGP